MQYFTPNDRPVDAVEEEDTVQCAECGDDFEARVIRFVEMDEVVTQWTCPGCHYDNESTRSLDDVRFGEG